DLQLPLYRRLATLIDIGREIHEDAVEVGYIALPKDLQKIGYAGAPWDEDEFYDAYMKADEIIRQVRAQDFWPPNTTPSGFDDGYGAICLDSALDRLAIIELDMGREAIWPERASEGEALHGE
ncbi:MAG TPA: hypothetical protein VFW40_08865, partial [Capsulimonadaceae bacterium]|nr:hypothetical protein [Capsulimonadaceae bacterium]